MNNTTQTNTVAVAIEALMQDNKLSSWKDYFNHMLFNMKMDTKKVKQELNDKNIDLTNQNSHCSNFNLSFVKKCLLKALQYGELGQSLCDFVLTYEQEIQSRSANGLTNDYKKLINVLTNDQLETVIHNAFGTDNDIFDYDYKIYHVSHSLIKKIKQSFHKITNISVEFEEIFDGVVENTPKGKEYYIIPDQPFNEKEMKDLKWEIYKRLLGGEKLD
ncbi:hypothetical protein DY052_05830 [Apilactobacillus timberlakei]|uniref:hypothetical protein n=1 Tax=Apilactobacillus timberlakei TaxID=2008380 RepID=UPI001126D286|nr:hypothetical protein [Apilactobacillus timberlakei]TPR14942.1 hypothetical protein DY052_05830 [Apilactobacillus timberlakei]